MIYQRYAEKLPSRIKALVYETPDGDFVILLNPIYSKEELVEASMHELKHIYDLDLENRDTKSVDVLETARHYHVDRED